MIKLVNVSKIYYSSKDNNTKALDNVSLDITEGENVAIVGVSGSGKSTLLNIIGCLDNATEGKYYFYNKEISIMKSKELAEMRNNEFGFVLQDNTLLYNESVYSNVRLPLVFSDKFKFKEHKSRINEVLKLLGIENLSRRKVRNLSGGQRQRVAIARAMVNNPRIILADEPTSALDSKTAMEIMEIFQTLNRKGITIITVTHDNKVVRYSDKVITIEDGKIIGIERVEK